MSVTERKVPGRQSVPRAETLGFLTLLQLRPRHLTRVLWVDASYVIKGFHGHSTSKRHAFEQGANGDLWCEIYTILDDFTSDPSSAPTFIYKVKSHEDRLQAAARGTPLIGWILNVGADAIAGNFARRCQLPSSSQWRPSTTGVRDRVL